MVQVHAPQGVEVRVLSWAPRFKFGAIRRSPENPVNPCDYGVFCLLWSEMFLLYPAFLRIPVSWAKSCPDTSNRGRNWRFATPKRGRSLTFLPDGPGLSLRIRPNGAKTWLLRYRRPGTGKENFLSLGPYPDISLIEAWRRAATARDLVREGTDPVDQRRADVSARKRAAGGAFHLVAKAWLEFKRKEWADETYRKAEFVLREYLTPTLRNKSISTLSTAQVKPILETIAAKAPDLASKARQYVGGIVSYAIHNDLREDGLPLALR